MIEDSFLGPRPPLEELGVQFVDNVHVHEQHKVWLLNGSHSMLAYVSYLMGYRAVDQAMHDPMILEFVRNYMDRFVTPVLPSTGEIDVDGYKQSLITRFSNSSISDTVQRLAGDGSTKIRNAVVEPLLLQLERGSRIDEAAFGVAAWIRYLRGVDEDGESIEIVDPNLEHLHKLADGDDPSQFLRLQKVFRDAGDSGRLQTQVAHYLHMINQLGTRGALGELLTNRFPMVITPSWLAHKFG